MTQKIRFARSGDRLSANYVNKIVDAANLAIDVLGPARSTRLGGRDTYDVPLDANGDGTLQGLGTKVYTETSRRTSTVKVEDPNDASIYVEIDRIDEVTLRTARGETITLVFEND